MLSTLRISAPVPSVVSAAHADAHVEPAVAVDQVVAAAAFDDVAAVAAEDDVAGAERTVTPAPSSSCRPSISAMLVSTLPCAPADGDLGRVGVVAAQDVG